MWGALSSKGQRQYSGLQRSLEKDTRGKNTRAAVQLLGQSDPTRHRSAIPPPGGIPYGGTL